MSSTIETIKGACPICGRDVKGNDRFLFYCTHCDVLFGREHLQLSTQVLNRRIKEAVVEQFQRHKGELPRPSLERLPLKPVTARRRTARIPIKPIDAPKPAAAASPVPAKAAASREAAPKRHPLQVVNLFLSTDLGVPMNPTAIAKVLPEAQYDTKKFPGLLLRYAQPKGTIIVFPSGRTMVTGVKTREQAHDVLGFAIARLRKAGASPAIPDRALRLSLDNITCSGTLGYPLNLSRLALKLPDSEYEPEDFPGLILRILDPRNTFILFENGKLVSAGAKSDDDVAQSFQALIKQLRNAGA